MKTSIEKFLHEPPGHDSTANSCHFLLSCLQGVGTREAYHPCRQAAPVLADVEGQVIDGTAEAIKSRQIFAVVPRCA